MITYPYEKQQKILHPYLTLFEAETKQNPTEQNLRVQTDPYIRAKSYNF